jgi:hypothetical protein
VPQSGSAARFLIISVVGGRSKVSALQWIAPFLIGALGALIGVYYRESFALARKVKLFVSRIDVLLTEMEYDLFSSELKPFLELGALIPILSRPDGRGKQPVTIESRAKTYSKLREAFRSTEEMRTGIEKILAGLLTQTVDDLAFAKTKAIDSAQNFEKETAFTKDEAFMALPFHVVFQWQRFTSVLSRVFDASEKLYRYAEAGRFDQIRSAGLIEDLLIKLIELLEIEQTLSKNTRNYREKRILGLTLRFMLSGRVR